MRLAVLSFAAASLFAGLPSVAMAEIDPYVLPAVSKWNVDYGQGKCRLSRTFGSGPNTHVLLLDQDRAGSAAAVTVAGPSFERFRVNREASIAFGDAMSIEAEPQRAQLGTMRYGIVFPDIDFGTPAQGAQAPGAGELDVGVGNSISYLTFTQKRRAVRLQTGPMGEAFDVLNDCTKNLARG